ncbi:MAG: hypothetical protein JW954_01960 [Dehalococcoidaceae bacterium]|nr:hypothetical protein [Dehalococcoidaceae bacterium]
MNIKHYVNKERLIFTALLLIVTTVVIYAPLRYGFIFPTGGDDTAHHINYLKNLTQDFGYITGMGYYGIALLVPFTKMGLNPVAVFSVFNYAVIIAVFVSLWVLVRRFYGFIPAVLSFLVSVFMVMSTWYYFEDGTIFNIFNLWVIAPLAFYSLSRWLEEGARKWLVICGALFVLTSLVHSATYLYIMASMLLLTAAFSFWQYRKKDTTMLKRTLIFGAVFSVSIITAAATWMHRLLPAVTGAMVDTVVGDKVSYAQRVSFINWLGHYLNVATLMLLILAGFILYIIFKKGTTQQKASISSKLNQPLSFILLAFVPVFAVGAFTLLGYNYDRFARDLATLTGLGAALLLGLGLTYYNFGYKKVWFAMVAVLIVASSVPVQRWLSDYTALRPCDQQAIQYLNEQTTSGVTVQHFSELAPKIYQLYTQENISFERAYDFSKLQDADYIIYRNNHMTFYTLRYHKANTALVIPQTLAEQESLTELERFTSGEDMVVIYQVEAP